MATEKKAAAAAESAPASPPQVDARCDLHSCGMPAVATTNKLNHCEHHRSWVDSRDADVVRAQKGL